MFGAANSMFRSCLVLWLVASLACLAQAQTIIWTGAAGDGQWNNPGNWNQNRVPNSADSVLIPSGTPAVSLPTSANVASVDCRGSLDVFGPSFGVAGLLRAVGSVVKIRSGSASLGGIEVLPGSLTTFDIDGSVVTTNSVLVTGGTLTIKNAANVNIFGPLTICPDLIAPGAIAEVDVQGGTFVFANFVQICPNGELRGSGIVFAPVFNGGRVVPGGTGGAGLLTISQTYTQQHTGELRIELGGPIPVSDYDVLQCDSSAQLDGLLRVSLIHGFVPFLGEFFDVLTSPFIFGTFTSYALPPIGPNLSWRVFQFPDRVRLMVIWHPGDLNSDCVVDEADLGILLGCWGPDACGDLDGDLITAESDLGILLGNWRGVCP
ncbi:MAG: hypothetical protein U1D55_15140 [Phycisphaerae bacterium]